MHAIRKIVLMLIVLPSFSCAMDNSLGHESVVACQKIQNNLMNYYTKATICLTVTNKTKHIFSMYGKNKKRVLAPEDTLTIYLTRMKTTQEIFAACSGMPETYKVGTDATLSFFDEDHNKRYELQAALYTYFSTLDDLLSGAGIAFLPKEMQEDSGIGYASCICYHGEAFEGAPDNKTQYNATVELQNNMTYSPKVNMKILGVNDTFFK